jgi:type VI protein secretion system component VasK
VIASIETHKISSRRAWLVFGIIGAILIVMSFGFIIAQRAMVEESSKYRKQLEQSTQEMQKNSEEARKALEEMQKQLEKK